MADNAILFIGDGMGPVQIAVAREAAGGGPLRMERTPFSGHAVTLSVGGKVTDSAAAGTALATGHKTENGMISVSPDEQRLETILERCRAVGKATGIITTDALHGATPATFASHAKSRGMRSEIAAQLAASEVQVMLGFWRGEFLPKSAGGAREDGRNLIAEMSDTGYGVVYTRTALRKSKRPKLLGLFDDGKEAPRLAEMVTAALERLGESKDGFFLVVEGARIDWKCHGNDPAGAVLDTWEFDEAIGAALDFADRRGRTLVVVTADHETGGMGYGSPRALRLLGRVKAPSEAMGERVDEGGGNAADVVAKYAGITDLTEAEVSDVSDSENRADAIAGLLSRRAGVSWRTKGHTSTQVRVLAHGAGAQRFAGDMDNTDVPRRIAEVLEIGPFPR